MSTRRIALATATDTIEPDPDERLMLDGFAAAGWDAELVAWDGPERDLREFAAIVLRSTWNYVEHVDRFRAWISYAASETRLFNPAEIVLNNLHKGYLLDLAARGIPAVPTTLLRQGERAPEMEPGKRVVKPAIGAGSWKVRVLESTEARAYAQELAQEEDVLIQPYISSVEDGGERALVWVDGQFTHKVVKRLRTETDQEVVSQALPLTDAEETVGWQALEGLDDKLLYARVDVMLGEDGQPLVSELELTEPSLFFLQNPDALSRLMSGLDSRLA